MSVMKFANGVQFALAVYLRLDLLKWVDKDFHLGKGEISPNMGIVPILPIRTKPRQLFVTYKLRHYLRELAIQPIHLVGATTNSLAGYRGGDSGLILQRPALVSHHRGRI